MNPKLLGILAALGLAVVLLWPSGSSQKVKELYGNAQTLYKNEDYEGAIEKYEASLEAAKKWSVKTEVIDRDFNTLANYKIAVCYAKIAEQTGDITYYDRSLEIIETIAQQATVPKHREGITYLWGHILYQTDQYELAEPKFRTLIENFPDSRFVENAWYAIGRLNYKLQEFDKARRAFKEILNNFPHSEYKDDAQQLIAQSFLKEENYSQAVVEFDKLTTEEFKNFESLQPEAKYKAAYCQKMQENDPDAIARYTTFISEHSDSKYVTAAYFDMGAIYAKQKNYDNARQNYQLALENTDEPALKQQIWNEIGKVYFDQEDYENAITAYNTLINDYPGNPYMQEAKLGIAGSHFRLNNWDDAVNAYERVINEHPEDKMGVIPYCTYQIGEAYYQSEKYEQALTWYQKVLDNYPDDTVASHALYGAVWSLSELGRLDEVQKLGADFIAKKREDPNFDAQAAEIQFRLGDIQFNDIKNYLRAAEEYAKVWDDYSDLPKFDLLKLSAKFQESLSYFESAKPEGYDETLDEEWNFNEEYLRKSASAYRQAIDKFSDANFDFERHDDFPERKQLVENCVLNQAVTYEHLKQWDKARENYNMVAKTSPHYSKTRLLIAQTYVEEGQVDKGITIYREALASEEINEDDKSLAQIKLADLLRVQKQFAEAAQQYQQIVDTNPTGEFADDAQYLVGLSYHNIKDDDPENLSKAIEAFQKVVDNYPESPNAIEAYYGIILARRDLAESDETQWNKIIETAEFAEAKYSDTEDEKAQETLSFIALIKAKALEETATGAESIDQLVAQLQKVVDNKSAKALSRTGALLKIGHLLYGVGRYQEAINAYEKLISMFPNSESIVNAHYQIAVCHFHIGEDADNDAIKKERMSKAVNATEKALKSGPDTDLQISINYTMGLAKKNINDNKGAISALQKVVSYEGKTENENRKELISQSHTRLAELYKEEEDYSNAVNEYQYIISHTNDKQTLERTYFALGYAYDEHLNNASEAVNAYQKAAEFDIDPLIQAQIYYRLALLYEMKLKDENQALQHYNTLISRFAEEKDSNIQAMVADSRVRRSTIFISQGRLEDAIADAGKARDDVMSSGTATLSQKILAWYQLGYLYLQKARGLFKEDVGQYDEDYRNAARQAAETYAKTYEIAKQAGIDKVPESYRVYIKHGIYQAGEVWYSLQFQPDLQKAIPILNEFVKLADEGYFGDPNDPGLKDLIKNALNYNGSSYYLYAELDPELFDKAAPTFKNLVKRYPNDPDAPLWQYHAGEAYFAAQKYQVAIGEYQKVLELNSQHEKAPDALYAISTCYLAISDATDDPEKKEEILEKVYALNERLASEYPESKYAPEAFINVGNKYYNQGSDPDITDDEKELRYRLAIGQYKRAVNIIEQMENIDPKTKQELGQSKNQALEYIRDTEYAISVDIYIKGLEQLEEARDELKGDEKKDKLNEAIQTFRTVANDFPDTVSGELSYKYIGMAYTMLAADFDESYYKDALKAYGYLWNKYATITPEDNQVAEAVRYAQQQFQRISAYRESIRIHEEASKE